MIGDDRTMPAELVEAHREGFDYRDGAGIDFEPYAEFMDAGETAEWWRAWTGNPSVDGAEFRIFGQDGTGGLAGFWCVRDGAALSHQPVVFLGSEGETGVVARDLAGYLWLLAGGFGPYEAASYPQHGHDPIADVRLAGLAERYAPDGRQSAAEVIDAARDEFPYFAKAIADVCR